MRSNELCECFDIITGKKVEPKQPLGVVKGRPSPAGAATDKSVPMQTKQPGPVQIQESAPATQKSVPVQTQQPVPTKPGFIWVDGHWERPRAEKK